MQQKEESVVMVQCLFEFNRNSTKKILLSVSPEQCRQLKVKVTLTFRLPKKMTYVSKLVFFFFSEAYLTALF